MLRYLRNPIDVVDGIEIFSSSDAYSENYEKIAGDHLKNNETGNDNPFISDTDWRIMESSTARLIDKVARPGMNILDLGVGTGRLLERYPDLNRYGVDISLQYLKIARGKGIVPIFSRSEELPMADGSFDILVTTDVLEHVLDLHATLQEMTRVVTKGGYIVIRVPYRENLAPYLAPDIPYEFVHLRNFDEFGLKLILEKIYGLEVIEEVYATIFSKPRLRFPAPRILKRILGELSNASKKMGEGYYVNFSKAVCTPIEISLLCKKRR